MESFALERNRMPPLTLPEVEILDVIGSGRRVRAYRARWRGRDAVVKRYLPDSERRCRRILGVSLAEFECRRNGDFHGNDALRRYCAQPFACLKSAEGESVFAQEYIDGQSLSGYVRALGYLPVELFEAGRFIVDQAERSGMHDLDLPAENLKVAADQAGPRPMLFDFNLIPQFLAPPNPFVALLYAIRLRKPSHRDYRGVNSWLKLAPMK